MLLLVALSSGACAAPKFATVPGQTEISVSGVSILARTGEQLEVNYKPLYEYMGLRKKDPVRPERGFNEYRLVEDRRRIEAYLHEHGHFDAMVDEPELTYSTDRKAVSVTWRVHEGPAYKIGSVELIGAPAAHADMLRAMIPFHAGSEIELETYRPLRRTMAEALQDLGYGHARGYSRTFVDKETKTVNWFYYIDAGPQTKIGSIVVEGNTKVPAPVILARAGLTVNGTYSLAEKRRAEMALLDTGAFASAIVLSDADIQSGPPEHPDTGGILAPDQIHGDGTLVPRKLDSSLSVRVIVVEAPGRQLRAEVGIEADPTRVDTYAGARVLFRNLMGPQHHLIVEGHVGYGVLIGNQTQADDGVYGSALVQYHKPGWLHRALDLRMTGRWRDVLYPDAMLREVVAGPGLRTNIAKNVFVDVDAFYRFGRQLDLPAIDAMTQDALALPTGNDSRGAVAEASIIADRRNDRVEATDGWLLSLRGSYSPGGAFGDHRWLQVVGDARAFHPLDSKWSIGVRGSAGIVPMVGAEGLPLGPRLFGGGSHGMRGYGRDQLSPTACDAIGECVVVGGRSLVESSVELRLLPFRKLYGAALFVDAGAAGAGTNAFENGISIATGVGARIRTWYLPVGFDVSYRVVEDNQVGGDLDRLLVFFRIGEAF